MNKIIKVVDFSTTDNIKKSIQNIIDQLEKDNYAHVLDTDAARLFSRKIKFYKDRGIIIVSKSSDKQIKNVFSIKHDHKIEKHGTFRFKVRIK